MDYNELNNKFALIENQIKERVCAMNVKDPFDSVMQIIANTAHSLTKDTIDNVYLTSVALLIDDFFQITFPEGEDFSVWDIYAFRKEGIIGDHCNKALETEQKAFAFPTKNDLIKYINLPQRDQFTTGKVNAFFISPIILQKKIVGNIVLSLENEITDDSKLQEIKDYLVWLNDKMLWIIYSEYLRLNAIIEKAEFLLNALDSVDEYQSYHSLCVSKLAKIFGFIISKNDKYKNALTSTFPAFKGIDIYRLQLAGLTHDIGKINMWSFEDFKTELEWRKRQLHPFFSYAILNRCEMSESVAEIAGNHHEAIKGQGEPFALELGNENNYIETQIIKFVDIVDSSIRERDKSKTRSSTDTRNSFDVALDAVEDNKSKFDDRVYNILYAILQDIRNGNLHQKFYQLFYFVQELLGIDRPPKPHIKVNVNNALKKVINKCLNKLDMNKWIVLFVFYCNNIDSYLVNGKIVFDNSNIDRVKKRNRKYAFQSVLLSDNLYLGIYTEKDNKEYAYSFCKSLDRFLGNENNLACAFLSHRVIHKQDFQTMLDNCIDTLKKTCQSMTAGHRWKLLKFDINKKEWK
jgi:HD-GYP domain-containing protein (c-di-GMP phosphodiesterase class II)